MLIGPCVMRQIFLVIEITGCSVMLARIDLTMALVTLLALPVVGGMAKFFGERIHIRSMAVQAYFGNISARVQENLAGVRVVRAFTREESEIESFKRMNHGFVELNRSLIRLNAAFHPTLHALVGILFVFVFYAGSSKLIGGTMTIGAFVAFQFYLGRMIWPLIAVGWVINLFQRGMASMKRLHEVLSVAPSTDSQPVVTSDMPLSSADLEIRDLTFSYGHRPVLRDIDLTVEHGQTIGIV